jgi:hypothetical protein
MHRGVKWARNLSPVRFYTAVFKTRISPTIDTLASREPQITILSFKVHNGV